MGLGDSQSSDGGFWFVIAVLAGILAFIVFLDSGDNITRYAREITITGEILPLLEVQREDFADTVMLRVIESSEEDVELGTRLSVETFEENLQSILPGHVVEVQCDQSRKPDQWRIFNCELSSPVIRESSD